MSTKVSELEKQLAAKEKEQERAAEVLAKAHAGRKTAEQEVSAAKEELARLQAAHRDGAGETWAMKQKWNAAGGSLKEAEKKLSTAKGDVRAKAEAHDRITDEVLALREQLAGPRLEALCQRVAGLSRTVQEGQGASESAAKELVRIYLAAVQAAPRREVLRRSNKFLLVTPRDEAMKESVARSMQIPGVEPGSFHLEYFRALAQSGEGGKFDLRPGQDLSPPPETEIIYGEPRLPPEIEAIRHLDLGVPFQPNGAAPGGKGWGQRAGGQRRLTFHEISHEIQAERKEGA